MLERRFLGELPAKPHTVFKPKSSSGSAATEYVFTRDGFAGGFTILYMAEAPTAVKSNGLVAKNYANLTGVYNTDNQLPVARRHLRSNELAPGATYLESRTALFHSPSTRLSRVLGMFAKNDPAFINADADELFFVMNGQGSLLTMYGRLDFRPHDYIWIPRSTAYVFEHQGPLDMFLTEGDPGIEIPKDFRNPTGQLKLEAPYNHRDFRAPMELPASMADARFMVTHTLRLDRITEHVYAKTAGRVIGWDGSVYPICFNIHDYQPKTSSIHLPPNLHLTFAGSKFVVCSFVPRLVDYREGAIPCPYPHSNVHCDEILFYVSGNFTSRKGIGPGSLSLHPAGLPHGPQPGNYFGSVGAKSTDEVAVMVDVWEHLRISDAALKIEDPNYPVSWVP